MSADSSPMPTSDLQRRCLYCDGVIEAWRPFHIRTADLSDFLRRLDVVGSNLERYGCPRCRSTDRERHLRLYFSRLDLSACVRGRAVLHVCPERHFGPFVQAHGPRVYVAGGLEVASPVALRLDLQHLPFAEGTFDLVIGNHVLEHVADVSQALAEVRRVLVPGGRFICQTPFAARLTRTLDDPHWQGDDDRCYFFGQSDHVRLFGADLVTMLHDAGFEGGLRSHAALLPDVEPEAVGVNEHEPFFDFVRPLAPEGSPR